MSESIADFGPPETLRPKPDFGPPQSAPAAAPPDPTAGVAYTASTSEMSPQDGAAALWQSSELGLDPRYTAENVKPLRQEHAQARLREQLARAPAVAEYMAQSPAHEALVKPDVPVLAMLGEALQLGFVDLGAALEGNRQAKQGLTPAEEQQLAFVEQVQGGGVAGADTLPRKVGAEIARASPTLAAFTSAALTGAAVGSVAGPIGAAAGGLVGAGIAAYTLNFGPLYRRLRGLTDDAGTPLLDEEQAKTWAAAGSTAAAAVQTIPMAHFLRAVPGVNAALQKVGLDAATKAATSTIGRAAIQRLAGYGGHVLAGATAMAAQSAANAATVELAKQQSGAEPDWSAVGHAAADGFTSGLMLAPLAAFEPGRAFLSDVGRIHNARLEAFALDAYAAMAKDLQVSKTNPAEAEALVAKLADQGNSPTVFVSPDGLSSEHMNEVARAVGPDAMAEAAATQGDVPVPMGKYLTQLADQHEAMRENVKLSPDGMTLKEVEKWQEAWHGTPHQFATFDVSKIGSGQGAATYGHGLYFAQAKETAETYRQMLSDEPVITSTGAPVSEGLVEQMRAISMTSQTENAAQLIERTRSILQDSIDSSQATRKQLEARGNTGEGATPAEFDAYVADSRSRLAELDKLRPSDLKVVGGGVTHRVAVPHSEVLLDYDKPLAEQPPAVLAALDRSGLIKPAGWPEAPDNVKFPNGEHLAMKMSRGGEILYRAISEGRGGPEAASEALRAAGVPGLQYLDEQSRAAGEGTRNFVIWDNKAIRMLQPGEEVNPKAVPPPPLPSKALRAVAEQMTEGKRLGDLAPGRRQQAADNAARKAAEAGAKVAIASAEGTPATPGRALNKLQEIAEFENARDLNSALAKAESAALKEAETSRKFLLGYTKDAQRAELGKAGQGYLEQVDRLLSSFELGQGTSRAEVGRRLATMSWIAEEQAQGRTPVIPDSVLAKLDRFVHWKEMTPQEMRDLRNAVVSVAHQAHSKNTILATRGRIDAAQGKAAIVDAAFTNVAEHQLYQEGDVVPLGERAADVARRAGAVVVRPEEYVRRIDGGNINGPMSTNFWHPLSEAYNDFLLLERKWAKPITDAIKAMPSEVKKRWRNETFVIAGKERTMEQAIVVGLNSMNPSNRSKLERGYSGVEHLGIQSWTPDHIEQFLSKLGRPEWAFIQTVVDALEGAWPEISAHEQRLGGIAPEKVQAQPFTRTLADGSTIELRGGYYPVIYDPKFPGRRQAAHDALFAANYTTAKTPQGRLNSRIEEYARPVALTLNGLPRVIREFAKDTAMREAVTSAYSVITDPTVTNALDRTIGDAGRRVLESAVRDTANDMALPANGAELALEFLATLRGGVVSSIFSWNFTQYLQNFSGFTQTLKHVPRQFVKGAMGRFLTEHSAFYDQVRGESQEMATRADHVNADTALAIRKLRGAGAGKLAEFNEMGMRFWASSDGVVSHITYAAARDHALASPERGGLGYDPETARRYAERTVRLSLGSGRTVDLPAFLRNPVLRQLAPFSGWTSAMFNDYLASSYNARKFWAQGDYGKSLKEFQGTIMAAMFLGLSSSLLVLKGPKDKEKDGLDLGDIGRWIAVEGILQPTQWIPFLGQPAKAVAEGEKLHFSLFVPPAGRPIETAANALASLHGKIAGDELDTEDLQKFGLKGLEALASAKGIPVVQLRNTAGYLLDEDQPRENALQYGLGVAGGKSRPGKLLNLAE